MEFKIGKIPVKVHGAFAITAILLSLTSQDPVQIAIFAVVMFVSVLLHELGHAVAGIAYGLTPRIDLHGMGGTTSWPAGRKIGWGKSIVVSFAGPMVGIVLGIGVLIASALAAGQPITPLSYEHVLEIASQLPVAVPAKLAVVSFIYVNAVWGIFNLAPMLPLDGGNILLAFLQIVTKGKGERLARYVSIVAGVAFGLWALSRSNTWGAVLCGLFLFRNVQALRQVDRAKDEVQYFERLKEGFAALERKDGIIAIRCAEQVLENTNVPELRFEALRLLSYARVLEGQWGPLMALLERCRSELGNTELARLEQAATESDRPEEARRIKELREMPAAVAGFR
jgi:Zn-dependent protease